MKRKMNKKGRVRFWTLFGALILAITTFFILYSVNKPENETGYIGNIALEVLNANAKGQKALEYIDEAAKVSSEDTTVQIMLNGGFSAESTCKKFGGFNSWKSSEQDCTPTSLNNEYLRLFSSKFYSYTDYYPFLQLSMNYAFILSNSGNILGKSSSMLEVPLFKLKPDELGYCRSKEEPKLYSASSNMLISQGRGLVSPLVSDPPYMSFSPTPNCKIAENRNVDTIVIHYTGGNACKDDIDVMKNPSRKAAAHYIICRDGTLHQLVADRDIAWHAGCEGKCSGTGTCTGECLLNHDINARSIGIELSNRGYLGDGFTTRTTSPANLIYTSNYGLVRKVIPKDFSDPVTISNVEIAGQGPLEYVYLDGSGKPPDNTILRSIQHVYWEPYTQEQYKTLAKLTSMLMTKYGINSDRIVGHEQIVERKVDPGPAFNWTEFRSMLKSDDSYDKVMPVISDVNEKQDNENTDTMLDFGSIYLDASFSTSVSLDMDLPRTINKSITEIEKICQLDEDCWAAEISKPSRELEKNHDWLVMRGNRVITKENGDFEAEKWKRYCETPNERVLYHFLSFYQGCNESLTDDCYCEFKPVPESEGGVGIGSFSKYLISSERDSSGVVQFFLEESTLGGNPRLPLISTHMPTEYYPQEILVSNSVQKEVTLANSQGANEDIDLDDLVLYKKGSKMMFAKRDGSNIELLDGSKKATPSKCEDGNTFKFCIIDKNKRVQYHDPTTDTVGQKNLTFRFAKYLVDTTPPPKLTGVKAYNKDNDEGSIVLEWMNSSSGDFSHYQVYCSESSFGGSVENHQPQFTVFNRTDDELLMIEMTKCNNVPIEDGKSYYFSVTPVDTSGNENKEIDEAAAVSSDDLPPGITKVYLGQPPQKEAFAVLGYDPSVDQNMLSWEPVDLNYDGSAIMDLDKYLMLVFSDTSNWDPKALPNVQTSTCASSQTCELIGLSLPLTQDLSTLDPARTYDILILGLDNNGNFLRNIVDPYVDKYEPAISTHRIEQFS